VSCLAFFVVPLEGVAADRRSDHSGRPETPSHGYGRRTHEGAAGAVDSSRMFRGFGARKRSDELSNHDDLLFS
jgi:hypothetical protein